jgi:large subunit ribosomal protein L25
MSTQAICLPASKREQFGKAEIRRMRLAHDTMPAVVYGAGKDVASISIEHRHVLKALENEAVYSQVLVLDIDGKKEKVVLKALQRHPYKQKIMHADFLRVSAKEKLQMHIPLHFINAEEAPGVKEGGVFAHTLTEVEVSCLPSDLPEFIEVDLGQMALDTSVHLEDLVVSDNVDIVALIAEEPQNAVVASLHVPKAEPAPEEEVAEGAEGADSNASAETGADAAEDSAGD